MNEIEKQILENQRTFISALSKLVWDGKDSVIMEALNDRYWETCNLLEPEKEKSIAEETSDALVEDDGGEDVNN